MLATEARQIGEWLVPPNRHESRDGPAVVGDHDFAALADIVEQARQILSRFAHTCGSHAPIVTHVAQLPKNAASYNAVEPETL